ncbi:Hypothetical protein, conserved [Brucella abortus str. 2308 A]|uniref:Uncharacterized protein n=3 Tax=Brucella TaxID=234 RepID=A9M5Z4_BRUC2|nr:hypothetical protein BR1334 [Brucella suis 1330]ABX62399.1 Hypothetical protein, conserved [Brucella canis ATCC 23365]ABY38428.1 Hypothetical protein, conserved [Brucella suis ATCC 23445]EEH14848.1 Hypothetical protein, conserved [Brucella ceti str. Cudo]EEP63253.1 Hypothetical protein, conserved [Brucella abortus str. 2308 A]EFG38258.1 conserved hypothetical protein [Brucella sp. NVSL 07-0026]EFM58058.1 Hypothetical protein BIBO2_3077 [Brucella sp. BO2]CDL76721.1 unnamed protein product 
MREAPCSNMIGIVDASPDAEQPLADEAFYIP